jgi:hypothetical protein
MKYLIILLMKQLIMLMIREFISNVLYSSRFPFYASEMFTYDIRPIVEVFFMEMKSFQDERTDSVRYQETLASELKEEKMTDIEKLEEIFPVTINTKESIEGITGETDTLFIKQTGEIKELDSTKETTKNIDKKKSVTLGKPRILRDSGIKRDDIMHEISMSKIKIFARRHEEEKQAIPKKKLPDEEMIEPEDSLIDEVLHNKSSTLTDCTSAKSSKPQKPYYFLLEKLLSLLAEAEPLNPVLAGYFAKVMFALIEADSEKLEKYLFQYELHVNNFIRHSYNKSIAEVIARLLAVNNNKDELLKEKQGMLSKVIEKLASENSSEAIVNTGYTLCILADGKHHLEYLLSLEALTKLFHYAKSGNPFSLRSVLTFFMVLYRTKIIQPVNIIETVFNIGRKSKFPELACLIRMSAEYLIYAKNYLEQPNKNLLLEMASGYSLQPFGADRLKIIEWLQLLITLKDGFVCSKLAELNFPGFLLLLIRKYDMNSMLHQKILRVVEAAMNTELAAYVEVVSVLW